MKARIVKQFVTEGIMDAVHGGGHPVYRLVVEDLAALVEHGVLHVIKWDPAWEQPPPADAMFKLPPTRTVAEVVLPDTLYDSLKEYLAAREATTGLVTTALSAFGYSETQLKERRKARVAAAFAKAREAQVSGNGSRSYWDYLTEED